MSESCGGNCSSCGESCASRREESLLAQPNAKSNVKKVIAVVSGKGGVGKSTVTSMLAVAMRRLGYMPNFQDIHISNVYVRGCKNGIVAHGAEGMIHDITIKDCNIFYNKKDKDIDTSCKISLENVNLSTFAQ